MWVFLGGGGGRWKYSFIPRLSPDWYSLVPSLYVLTRAHLSMYMCDIHVAEEVRETFPACYTAQRFCGCNSMCVLGSMCCVSSSLGPSVKCISVRFRTFVDWNPLSKNVKRTIQANKSEWLQLCRLLCMGDISAHCTLIRF